MATGESKNDRTAIKFFDLKVHFVLDLYLNLFYELFPADWIPDAHNNLFFGTEQIVNAC